MGCGDGFDGVADEFAARQGKAHTAVAHGDTVADADSRKFDRCTTGGSDAELDGFGNVPQMDVAGDDFIKGITDADQGLLQIFIAIAHGVKKGSVGRTGKALFYDITMHVIIPFFAYISLTGTTPRERAIWPVRAISIIL